MPICTLEFSLPEEADELRSALQGDVVRAALFDLDQRLRMAIKHPCDGTPEDVTNALEDARRWLHECLDDNGVEPL